MNVLGKKKTSKKFHTCYGPVKSRSWSPGHTHHFLCADRDKSLEKLEKCFPKVGLFCGFFLSSLKFGGGKLNSIIEIRCLISEILIISS